MYLFGVVCLLASTAAAAPAPPAPEPLRVTIPGTELYTNIPLHIDEIKLQEKVIREELQEVELIEKKLKEELNEKGFKNKELHRERQGEDRRVIMVEALPPPPALGPLHESLSAYLRGYSKVVDEVPARSPRITYATPRRARLSLL